MLFKHKLLLAFTIVLNLQLTAFSAHAAETRTVFVQLFEWPWRDVAEECEKSLGPAGFAAVQISPPQEHLIWPGSPWWTRYQPVSYKLESRSGNRQEFASMVKRCRAAGVEVYADTVFNHMTGVSSGTGSAGSTFSHYKYEGLYSYNDFHHCNRNGNDDILNFSDRYEVQRCELLNLADLNTESAYVQTAIANYLNDLLDLGVGGIRIDAAKHIAASDIQAIIQRLNKKTYVYQELLMGYNDVVRYSDYVGNGDVTDYVYPFLLGRIFLDRRFDILPQIGSGPIDSSDAIVFLTNHDMERMDAAEALHNQRNPDLYRLAQVFMLTWPYGYPQVYSGYRFGNFDQSPPLNGQGRTESVLDSNGACRSPWTCEHRRPEVLNLVRFRNATNSRFYVSHFWSNNSDRIAYGRGSAGFVVINASQSPMKESLGHGLAPGSYCNLLDPSYDPPSRRCADPIRINQSGRTTFEVGPMSALVLMNPI